MKLADPRGIEKEVHLTYGSAPPGGLLVLKMNTIKKLNDSARARAELEKAVSVDPKSSIADEVPAL
jgi:hypothetical protein